MSDLHALVAALATAGPDPAVRLRQGSIVSVASDGTATITIGGSTTQVAGVKVASPCCPVPGASCWVATDGRDLWVLSTLAPTGPAWGTMRKSTTQTIATATWTALSWSSRTETEEHGITLGSAGMTVVVPGVYTISTCAAFAADTAGERYGRLTLNGNGIGQTSGGDAGSFVARCAGSTIVACAVGDVIGIEVYQNSGGNLATEVGSGWCFLSAAWLGPAG